MGSETKPILYVQAGGYNDPPHEHCVAAWQGFKWLGYQIRFVAPEYAHRLKLSDETAECVVVGSVELIERVLKNNGITCPKPLNVPPALMSFAGRVIEKSTLGQVTQNGSLPFFVKPAEEHKLWTGGVITNRANAKLIFSDYQPDTPVLVSPVIEIESEYRVFVDRNRGMAGMRHYAGNPFIVPSSDTIEQMITAFADTAPIAYSLDVGIVGKETVVVECNDFWGLGSYGFDPIKYAQLTARRWHELTRGEGL